VIRIFQLTLPELRRTKRKGFITFAASFPMTTTPQKSPEYQPGRTEFYGEGQKTVQVKSRVTKGDSIIKNNYVFVIYGLRSKLLCLFIQAGNTKGGSIIVPLTSCLTGLESAV
jgi:hypothetical protein